MRNDGRSPDQLRQVTFERDYTMHADGSVLVSFGNTKVLCTVCCVEGVPRWRKGQGGWLTAEYDMLPSSTSSRKERAAARGKRDGRGVEIQRLIGRSLRGIIDLAQIDDITLHTDCDVIQADGGTRTAAITGAWVALYDACMKLKAADKLKYWPLVDGLAAISVGVIDGLPMLDLDYSEDVRADVDMNVVMRANGEFVEVQGTGEGTTYARETLNEMLDLATAGCTDLIAAQRAALGIE